MRFLWWLMLPLMALSLPLAVGAQEPIKQDTVPNESHVSPHNTTAALLIPPRFTVDYNSSGGGYDGFGGVEFMLPIQQQPGQGMDYLLGRLNLTNGADVGGNLLFGSRRLGRCWMVKGDCLIGGYVGIDLTNTGDALFPQLGLGLEMLGDLELRLNGYVALGESQRRVETGQFIAPTGVQFKGQNLLFLDANNGDRYQTGLSGFDMEVGGKLLRFGNGGDLRGYGAVYNYGGVQVDRYWGGRLRLEVRPNDVLSVSAGVQFDPEFGTTLLFRIAATFPSVWQRQKPLPNSKLEQLAEPPQRQASVVVVERTTPVLGPAAVDPSTGKPYEFIHVSPDQGNANGSGTVEAPTNTIQTAISLAKPTTNVIYVQPGNAGGGFRIPDGIAVLSVAPVQIIATQFGPVRLPGSGKGAAARPVITDTVTMGNGTTLSGFSVQPPANRSGIVVENAGNVEISHNQVSVTNTLGNSVFFRSYGVSFAGILVRNLEASETVIVKNNIVSTSGDYYASGINGNIYAKGDLIITGNTVTTRGDNISFYSFDYTSPGYALGGIGGNSSSGGKISIVGNTVITTGNNSYGISGQSFSEGSILISNNRVMTSGNGSIGIRGNSGSFYGRFPTYSEGGDLTITGNTVRTTGINADAIRGSSIGNGWFFPIYPTTPGKTITIAGNTIISSGAGSSGISVSGPATISSNRIEQSGLDGVRVSSNTIPPTSCLALSNNISKNSGSNIGYRLMNYDYGYAHYGNNTFQIIDSSSIFTDTQNSNIGTFIFEPSITSFINVSACP